MSQDVPDVISPAPQHKIEIKRGPYLELWSGLCCSLVCPQQHLSLNRLLACSLACLPEYWTKPLHSKPRKSSKRDDSLDEIRCEKKRKLVHYFYVYHLAPTLDYALNNGKKHRLFFKIKLQKTPHTD